MTTNTPAPADLVEAVACAIYAEDNLNGLGEGIANAMRQRAISAITAMQAYMASQPDPRDAEIERLREALEAFLNDGPCWDFGEWFESRCKQARTALKGTGHE